LIQARLQEATFRGLVGQFERSLIRVPRSLGETKPSLHIGARGMGQVVAVQAALRKYHLDRLEWR